MVLTLKAARSKSCTKMGGKNKKTQILTFTPLLGQAFTQ